MAPVGPWPALRCSPRPRRPSAALPRRQRVPAPAAFSSACVSIGVGVPWAGFENPYRRFGAHVSVCVFARTRSCVRYSWVPHEPIHPSVVQQPGPVPHPFMPSRPGRPTPTAGRPPPVAIGPPGGRGPRAGVVPHALPVALLPRAPRQTHQPHGNHFLQPAGTAPPWGVGWGGDRSSLVAFFPAPHRRFLLPPFGFI